MNRDDMRILILVLVFIVWIIATYMIATSGMPDWAKLWLLG